MGIFSRLTSLDTALDPAWLASLRGALAQPPEYRQHRPDQVLAFALGLVAVLVAVYQIGRMPVTIYADAGFDLWFQADQPRVLGALAERTSAWHYRDSVHPLFSILLYPPIAILRAAGMSTLGAAQALLVAAAFISNFFLFLALRMFGVPRAAACLSCAAFVVSAAFMCWFGLVETYAFSACSTVLALYLLVRARGENVPLMVLASLITLSITVTNWSLALIFTVIQAPFGRAVRVGLIALLLAVGLARVQHKIFPHAGRFYVPQSVTGEMVYTDPPIIGGHGGSSVVDKLRSSLISSAVAPGSYYSGSNKARHPILSNQLLSPGYDTLGLAAVACWIAMLGLSFVGLGRGSPRQAAVALLLFVAAQAALFAVYGEIAFLFVANFFPALLALASLGSLTKLRRPWTVAACAFILIGGIYNFRTYDRSIRMIDFSLAHQVI